MSSNVGLSTPRGSGTSGYVQRNLSHLKTRDRNNGAPYSLDDLQKHKQRKPDAEILEHERKRQIEVKLFELRDKLEDEGVDEDEIDEQVDKLRKKLEAGSRKDQSKNARGLKAHQVHDLAKAKIEETERVRKAFGIGEDYEEGSHWRKQDERRKELEMKRLKDEVEEEEATRKESSRRDSRSESVSDVSSRDGRVDDNDN
jgi:cwf21 domain